MATIQKRKKKNGTFSYRVMIRQSDGYPPACKTFPTRQEAKDWGAQEEARRRQNAYFPDQNKRKHTFAELVDRYVEIVLPSKPNSAKDMLRHLQWWSKKLGRHALQTITPDMIAHLRQELAVGITPTGKQRSPGTVNRYMATLSGLYSYAVKECCWLNENPCFRVSKLKESKGRDRILKPDECSRLIKACKLSKSEYILPIVLLAISTGMRQGEILKLQWTDIDFDNQQITIKQSKNGRPRTVSLVGEAQEILQKLYLSRSIQSPLVFPSKKMFSTLCIKKAWNEALKRAGIENLRFHDLRHTFATYAAEAGASNMELATAMGHQTLQMLQRYTHMNAKITHRLSSAVNQKLIGTEDGKKQVSKAS